jgi:hypothetical protein
MPEQQLELLWYLAPEPTKLELALSLIAEVLKVVDDNRINITLDDGDYEIVMNKLEATTDQK